MGNKTVQAKEIPPRSKSVGVKERELPLTIRLVTKTSLDQFIENCVLQENSPQKSTKTKKINPLQPPRMKKKQSQSLNSEKDQSHGKHQKSQKIYEKDVEFYLQTWDSNTNSKKQNLKSRSPNKKITIHSIMQDIENNKIGKNGQFKQSLNHEDMRCFFPNNSKKKSRKDLKLIRVQSGRLQEYGNNIKKITLAQIQLLSKESSSIDIRCPGFPCYQTFSNAFVTNNSIEN